jgi:hypothetical protein
MVKRDMEILVIGVVAGAIAAGVIPFQGVIPKFF